MTTYRIEFKRDEGKAGVYNTTHYRDGQFQPCHIDGVGFVLQSRILESLMNHRTPPSRLTLEYEVEE